MTESADFWKEWSGNFPAEAVFTDADEAFPQGVVIKRSGQEVFLSKTEFRAMFGDILREEYDAGRARGYEMRAVDEDADESLHEYGWSGDRLAQMYDTKEEAEEYWGEVFRFRRRKPGDWEYSHE